MQTLYCRQPGNAKDTQGQNYLMTNEDSNSSSSDEESNTKVEPVEKLPNPLLEEKLPTPDLGNVTIVAETSKGSVFANRYESAEQAKKSILEKHVKMTVGQFHTGKKAKICKKFKQGRCFYGNNCQYSHDIDSNLSLRYKKDELLQQDGSTDHTVKQLKRHNNPHAPQLPAPPRGFMGTMGTMNTTLRSNYSKRQQHQFHQQQNFMQTVDEDGDDDKFNAGDKRKKRVGVSQSLVPPKKAMAALSKQREEERPWTLKS